MEVVCTCSVLPLIDRSSTRSRGEEICRKCFEEGDVTNCDFPNCHQEILRMKLRDSLLAPVACETYCKSLASGFQLQTH
eukprot:12845-Heterococcus_DN1.PRE.2